jgi:arylsulfatase A-like enzyme
MHLRRLKRRWPAPFDRFSACAGIFVAGLTLLVGCVADDSDFDLPPNPDVLLVVLDTVRADRLSTYGYERPTAIQIDALAESGVVFEDVTAPAPWTYPSHASIFTGEPPWVHGARIRHDAGDVGKRSTRVGDTTVIPLRADLPTLAERFSASGYRTAAVVVNVWLTPKLGLVRGFETVEVFDHDGPAIQAAKASLDEPDDRPLFLFVNLLAAHSPYREGPGPWRLEDRAFLDPALSPEWVRPYLFRGDPPGVHLDYVADGDEVSGVSRYNLGELSLSESDLGRIQQLYDAGVRAADYGFGRILEAWLTQHAEGVVAVTSDHGEAFGEHGLLGHRGAVYPELLKVPLVMAAPGRLPVGVRIATPVQLQDLYATLLDLAGIEASPRSLLHAVEGKARREPVEAEARPDEVWARAGGARFQKVWRLYRRGDAALVWSDAGEHELYDLDRDPHMQDDLSARDTETVANLSAAAKARHVEVAGPTRDIDIPQEAAERLRQMGYLR